MPIKWIGFIAFVWIVLLFIGATFDAQTEAADTWGPSNDTTLNYVVDIRHILYDEEETGALSWLTPNKNYFDALLTLITWDFSFLKCSDPDEGCGYEVVRWVVLVPFTIAAIFGLIYMFVQLLQGFIPHT